MVINTERELEKLTLQSDTDWEKHMERFQVVIRTLASYDKTVSLEDQVSKLIWTLRQRFVPIAMYTKSSSVPFEKVIASVKVDISRRQTHSK